jgi:ABC-type nickel/cobalt efflux system permease component RcnA
VRRRPTPPPAALLAVALVTLLVATATAAAAPSPFGIGLPEATAPSGFGAGLFVWLAERQAAFNRALYAALRLLRTDTTALWSLIGMSFVYGVLHAAGPGHGKAVIGAYLVATRETIGRGVLLAFVSAAVQALAAVVLVGIATHLLNLTAVAVTNAALGLELASGIAVTALGLWLLARRLRALRAAPTGCPSPTAAAAVPTTPPIGQRPADGQGGGRPRPALRYRGATVGPAETCAACGVVHPAAAATLRQAVATVLSVGLRPCTGALVVLTFAFSLKLWWAGVAAVAAMALGTGVTVAAVAVLTVVARGTAEHLAGADTTRPRLAALAGVAGAAAVLAIGVMLLGASLIGTAVSG